MLGIWYLFSWIDLFKSFESSANFIDGTFFFTAIAIGDMKCSSEQLDSFSMCPAFCKRSNSTVTLGCRLIETRQAFRCLAVNFWLNFGFATWVFERPFLETKYGNCDAIASLILHAELSILLTHIPLFACCKTTARPRLSKRSLLLCPWLAYVHPPQLLVKPLCKSSLCMLLWLRVSEAYWLVHLKRFSGLCLA